LLGALINLLLQSRGKISQTQSLFQFIRQRVGFIKLLLEIYILFPESSYHLCLLNPNLRELSLEALFGMSLVGRKQYLNEKLSLIALCEPHQNPNENWELSTFFSVFCFGLTDFEF